MRKSNGSWRQLLASSGLTASLTLPPTGMNQQWQILILVAVSLVWYILEMTQHFIHWMDPVGHILLPVVYTGMLLMKIRTIWQKRQNQPTETELDPIKEVRHLPEQEQGVELDPESDQESQKSLTAINNSDGL